MLTTTTLYDRNLDHAIGELLANAQRVVVAGFVGEAYQALSLLMQTGPWRMPAHGALVHQLQRLLPSVSLLAKQPCPAIGDQAMIALSQQEEWRGQHAQERLHALAMVGRNQLRPAGADWSHAFLSTLAQRRGKPGEPRQHAAFGAFCVDAEFVLKARIAQQFGCSTALVDLPSADELATMGLPADALASLMAQLQAVGRIDIAVAATTIDTLEIARATAGYVRDTGQNGGYLVNTLFQACWLLLIDEGREADAVEVAGDWLAHDADACANMLDLTVVPTVGRFLSSGQLAKAVQVDARAVKEWLTALQSRRAPDMAASNDTAVAPPKPSADLMACLQDTPLRSLKWLQMRVLDSSEYAWAAAIPVADRKQRWLQARALVEQTGRWPLVTTLWSGTGDDPAPDRLANDLFMRFPYECGPTRDDVSPRSFIATSRSIDVDDFLALLAEHDGALDDPTQLEIWRGQLEVQGVPLTGFDKAWAACGGDRMRFERWLAEHEQAHGKADPEQGRQPAFEPDNAWLILLPTRHGEEGLAYMHWYGIAHGGADSFIALLRRWRERYGAELLAHYGTMLEFAVQRPPQDFQAALELAREHDLTAPCTLGLPGIALRHHALGLIGHEAWFLHERP